MIYVDKSSHKLGVHATGEGSLQNIFKFPIVLEEKTKQKSGIFSEETKRKQKFSFLTSEIIGNRAFPLSVHGEYSHEILIFFDVALVT